MFNPYFWFCLFLVTAGSWTWVAVQFAGWWHG